MEDAEKKRILVIEDEEHIAEGIKLNLSLQGYGVKIAPDGIAGLNLWRQWQPDLIILDIMLPMVDGLSVLRTIRGEDQRQPVLILSAKGSAEDRVRGLRCGVDDYLAKPFDLDEFLLRVERLLARKSWYTEEHSTPDLPFPGETYSFGKNIVNFITCQAESMVGTIDLTEQEIKLLKVFIANRGKPVSRQKLLEAGWGYASNTSTRTADNFMVRFRKYFEEDSKNPVFFRSRRSVGYIFNH